MFREIFKTCFTIMQHLGSHISKLIRCKCDCCHRITYNNTCSGIHRIYIKLSSKTFEQTSSEMYTTQQLNEYVRNKQQTYWTNY